MWRRSQLEWLCRRGTRELDLLLHAYLDAGFERADPLEHAAFRRLLECPDPQLQDWLYGRSSAPEPELDALVAKIRALADA